MHIKDFDVIKPLGTGTSGSMVYLCVERSTGREMVVKNYFMKDSLSSEYTWISREISILNMVFGHRHFVQIVDVIWPDTRDSWLCSSVLEACPGTLYDLLTKNERLPLKLVLQIVLQIAYAICHLHVNNIVHNDLKLENVLVSTLNVDEPIVVKICDFNLSIRITHGEKTLNRAGSLGYSAPEVVLQEEPYFPRPAEIWSLGVIFYLLLSKKFPFPIAQGFEQHCLALRLRFRPPLRYFSEVAEKLLDRFLAFEPSSRPTIYDVTFDLGCFLREIK